MTATDQVEQFEATIGKGKDASFEEFRREVRNAYMDRTRQVYFIWKKLKETYPEVDADRVVREAAWNFGVYQGRKIAMRAGRDDLGPSEVLLGQTSKGGMAVFDQEIVEIGEDRAIKIFHSCPHVDALTELGASASEITHFCRNILSACDFGICYPFKEVEIEFPTTVADHTGHGCQMIIRRRKKGG
jgi:hypothetical protein